MPAFTGCASGLPLVARAHPFTQGTAQPGPPLPSRAGCVGQMGNPVSVRYTLRLCMWQIFYNDFGALQLFSHNVAAMRLLRWACEFGFLPYCRRHAAISFYCFVLSLGLNFRCALREISFVSIVFVLGNPVLVHYRVAYCSFKKRGHHC
jgi:hypothetical protein